mgnify:CR=1 FL=1
MGPGFLKFLTGVGKAIGGVATNLFTGQANSAISAARQQSYNERNMALQHEYQKKMIDYINNYNLPTKSVARWKAAGIAPQAVFGNSPGGAGISSDASAPSSDNPSTDTRSFDFTQTLAEQQRVENEKKVADSQADLNRALADKARGDTKDLDTAKRSQLVQLSRDEIAKETEEVRRDILKIQKDFIEVKESNDVAIQRAKCLEIIANCDKLLADKDVAEEMKEKIRADKELAQEMVNTEKSKQRSLESGADLADAQAKTENELRRLRKSLTQNQIKEITQKIRESRVLTAQGIEKFSAWLKGDREANSLFGVIDKYISGAGKDLLQQRFNNDVRNYLYDLMNDRE